MYDYSNTSAGMQKFKLNGSSANKNKSSMSVPRQRPAPNKISDMEVIQEDAANNAIPNNLTRNFNESSNFKLEMTESMTPALK